MGNFVTEQPQPEVGMGATLLYPQDRYPYVITAVTAKTITVQRVETVSTKTGHSPSHYNGPYPVWSHTYTAEELDNLAIDGERRAYLHRDGRYYLGRTPLLVGEAIYHRDFSW